LSPSRVIGEILFHGGRGGADGLPLLCLQHVPREVVPRARDPGPRGIKASDDLDGTTLVIVVGRGGEPRGDVARYHPKYTVNSFGLKITYRHKSSRYVSIK